MCTQIAYVALMGGIIVCEKAYYVTVTVRLTLGLCQHLATDTAPT